MKSVKKEDDLSIYSARKLLKKFGFNCPTLHSATIYVKDIVEIHRAIYYGKISLDFAHELSSPIMVVHSNVSRRISKPMRNTFLKKIFGELCPYAHNLGIKLALENLSYASDGFGKNVSELEEIFGLMNGGNVGFTLDLSHAAASGTTFSLLEKYKNCLYNVHVSDRTHKSLSEKTPNLNTVITKLKEVQYDGPLTLELSRKCTNQEILKTRSILKELLKDKNS